MCYSPACHIHTTHNISLHCALRVHAGITDSHGGGTCQMWLYQLAPPAVRTVCLVSVSRRKKSKVLLLSEFLLLQSPFPLKPREATRRSTSDTVYFLAEWLHQESGLDRLTQTSKVQFKEPSRLLPPLICYLQVEVHHH